MSLSNARNDEIEIYTEEVFEPLLGPARYKGAYGGRGSGKSHFFAELLIEDAQCFPGESGEGLRAVCIREVQKTLQQSAKRLLESKLLAFGLGERQGFKVYQDRIATPYDGLIIFQGMQDHTADSIKSLEGFHRAWAEEAQTISSLSLELLRPTIRWEDKTRGLYSQLWFSWNPRRKNDAVDAFLRGSPPDSAEVVRANWSDNSRFPDILEQERQDCLVHNPDQYDHIWEGAYVSVVDGAYYAKALNEAEAQQRICRVAPDPLFAIKIFCDIGGTGARSDAFSMWAVQFVSREIRVLSYYEAQGQELGYHLAWLRDNGYVPPRAEIYLPHDGRTQDRVFAVSYESAFKQAGYKVTVVPNQGRGAASGRIEAARRLFPQMWFNRDTTAPGREALGWYHAKKDENRDIDLGPEHDWSSHGADSFGMMALCYKPPRAAHQHAPAVIHRPRDPGMGY